VDIQLSFGLGYDRTYLDDEFLAIWVFDDGRNCSYTILCSVGLGAELFSQYFEQKKSGCQYDFLFCLDGYRPAQREMAASSLNLQLPIFNLQ